MEAQTLRHRGLPPDQRGVRDMADTDPAPILHVMGGLRLEIAGGDACPRSRKARALLGYLAVVPDHAATRERLSDLLWTDRGAEQARGSLRQALAEIRQHANGLPLLAATRERVALAPGAVRTDIDHIEAAAGRREAGDLARCVDRIRGPFLDELDGLSSVFDEWLYSERPRQHDRVVSSVLEAAPDMIGRGSPADWRIILRSLERLDPLNEAVARLAMRVDHAGRDMASLHRRYRRLTDGLTQEFGSPPSEATQSLFAELTCVPEPEEAADGGDAFEPAPASTPARSAPPTIIVASIDADGSADAADLAAIATDDVRAALTRLPHLRVIALDTPDERRLAAACAGAVGAYLLSGRLRRVGDQLSVTLRLGDVEDQAMLWSEHLRVDAADLFAAIERIVERAAGAVSPSIDRDLARKLGDGPVASGDAALLFTEARIRIRRAQSLACAQEACALLERVLELAPDHLAARLWLARMYNTDFWQQIAGHDVRAFRARADRLCREAAALEPSNVDVLIHRAWCYLRRRDWGLAEREFERVIERLPYDADTIDACAFGLCHLGELERAEPLFQRAFRLNPFPPADYHADRAVMLALRGDAEAAEEHFEVSGERGLQYLAIRLANLQRIEGADRTGGLAKSFARLFREAWQQPRPPVIADVLAWVDDTLPLKRPEHRELVQGGLAAALGERW